MVLVEVVLLKGRVLDVDAVVVVELLLVVALNCTRLKGFTLFVAASGADDDPIGRLAVKILRRFKTSAGAR